MSLLNIQMLHVNIFLLLLLFVFLLFSCLGSLYILGIFPLSEENICKYFLPFCRLSLNASGLFPC
jgi:hypothetical protein